MDTSKLVEPLSATKKRAVSLELIAEGWARPSTPQEVDQWYAEAGDGARTYMANKLAKHGYPQTDKWAHREADPGGLNIKEIVRQLKSDEVSTDSIVKEWFK